MEILIRFLADALLVPIVIGAIIVVLGLPASKRWQAITRGGVASLTALWFAKLASQFYDSGVRPFVAKNLEPGASFLPNPGFPSDHALLAFAACFVVLAATGNKHLALVLFFLSALVALGRVLALVHSPADVIGSFIVVSIAALIWYGPRFRQIYY